MSTDNSNPTTVSTANNNTNSDSNGDNPPDEFDSNSPELLRSQLAQLRLDNADKDLLIKQLQLKLQQLQYQLKQQNNNNNNNDQPGLVSGSAASVSASAYLTESPHNRSLLTIETNSPKSPIIINNTALSQLLSQLNMNEYLPIFISEKLNITDCLSLTDSELKLLIPELGPRKRLINHLIQQKNRLSNSNTPPPAATNTTNNSNSNNSTVVPNHRRGHSAEWIEKSGLSQVNTRISKNIINGGVGAANSSGNSPTQLKSTDNARIIQLLRPSESELQRESSISPAAASASASGPISSQRRSQTQISPHHTQLYSNNTININPLNINNNNNSNSHTNSNNNSTNSSPNRARSNSHSSNSNTSSNRPLVATLTTKELTTSNITNKSPSHSASIPIHLPPQLNSSLCMYCQLNHRCIQVHPCTHIILCPDCAPKCTVCPQCHSKVDRISNLALW